MLGTCVAMLTQRPNGAGASVRGGGLRCQGAKKTRDNIPFKFIVEVWHRRRGVITVVNDRIALRKPLCACNLERLVHQSLMLLLTCPVMQTRLFAIIGMHTALKLTAVV